MLEVLIITIMPRDYHKTPWVDTHRAEGLVTLLDDLLDLSQHCNLCVLQLLLLLCGVCNTHAVRGLCFLSLTCGT